MVKNLPANAGEVGDMGLIPGWGRSPGGGNGNPLQSLACNSPLGCQESDMTEHICTSSLEKYLFRSSVHFLIGFFFLVYIEIHELLLYILEVNPLLIPLSAKIFSHSKGCLLLFSAAFYDNRCNSFSPNCITKISAAVSLNLRFKARNESDIW